MLIKVGRFRLMLTVLPKIPAAPLSSEVIALERRIAIRKANHLETSHLERRKALAKFGAANQ